MHSCSAHKFDGRRKLIKIEVDNLLDLDALTELNVSDNWNSNFNAYTGLTSLITGAFFKVLTS